MAEITKTQIWVPGRGDELNQEFPVPPTEELLEHWDRYLGSGSSEVVPAPGVYGAIRIPEVPPAAYASVDLCEVVRQTGASVRTIEELAHKPVESVHHYAQGLSISRDVVSVVQVLMANALVPPVDGIDRMAEIMQRWRKAGGYVVANTSTLPGCELGTIKFLETYLPGSFDGILLPRNHDGTLPMTKGVAARFLLQSFGVGEHTGERIPVVHIDDAPHHTSGFRVALDVLPGIQTATFQPIYPSHLPPDPGSTQTLTPLEAFEKADDYLAARIR